MCPPGYVSVCVCACGGQRVDIEYLLQSCSSMFIYLNIFYFSVHGCFACTCVCIMCVPGSLKARRRESGSLGLELQLEPPFGAGN